METCCCQVPLRIIPEEDLPTAGQKGACNVADRLHVPQMGFLSATRLQLPRINMHTCCHKDTCRHLPPQSP